jgi:hypothetical protein
MATAVMFPRSAADVLRDNPLPLLRNLCVSETEDELTISGRVCSYYYKQLAQEAVLPLLGHRRLNNVIVVQPGS